MFYQVDIFHFWVSDELYLYTYVHEKVNALKLKSSKYEYL